MTVDFTALKKRLDRAKAERARYEPTFDDAIRLTMPGRRRFNQSAVVDPNDIFDETGANATAEFVSRMLAGIIPPFTKFVTLEAGSEVPQADRQAVNRDLDEITEYMFEQVWDSNFSQETAESFYDLALSTGAMFVEDGHYGKALHHKAVPLTDLFLEEGADGTVGGRYRCSRLRAGDIFERFPNADDTNARLQAIVRGEADRTVEVIEYSRTLPGPEERFRHEVLVPEAEAILISRELSGAGSDPLLVYRWSVTAGEVWGRGPLMNALAAIRTTNAVVELVLENAAMSIVGMYQTDNDGIVNADNIQLLPGTIIAKEFGSQGLEPIQAATGNFNMRDVILADQRLNIKRAMLNDMLADPNKTPATATEVAERMADLATRTAAGFARTHNEFVQKYIRRVLRLLEKRGDIELPTVGGRAINIRSVSPLAQAQHGRDIQRLIQDFQVRAGIWGPQIASSWYDMEELDPWMRKRMGLDDRIYKSAKDVAGTAAKYMAAMQAQQQQQAQAQAPA